MKGWGNRPVLEMICILPALWVKDHLQMPHRTQGYRGPNGAEDVLAVCRAFTTQAERPAPLPYPQHRSQECQPTAGPRLYPPDPPPLPGEFTVPEVQRVLCQCVQDACPREDTAVGLLQALMIRTSFDWGRLEVAHPQGKARMRGLTGSPGYLSRRLH